MTLTGAELAFFAACATVCAAGVVTLLVLRAIDRATRLGGAS